MKKFSNMSRPLARIQEFAVFKLGLTCFAGPKFPYERETRILATNVRVESAQGPVQQPRPKLKFRLLKRYKYTTYTCLKVDGLVFLLPIPKQKLRLPEVERCNQCSKHAVALVYVGDYNVPVCKHCEMRTWFSYYKIVRAEYAASESFSRVATNMLNSYYTPERLEQHRREMELIRLLDSSVKGI